MATYSITTTALALGCDRKRVENLLNRSSLPEAAAGSQGRARRLRQETVIGLAAVMELEETLGLSAPAAAQLVKRLGAGGTTAAAAALRVGSVAVSLDFSELQQSVSARLAEALEIAPRPARGRPRNVRSRDNA